MKSRRAGFTLLEILTTIAIFGILVTITGYVYASALSRSRDQQRISDLQTISNGLEQFYLDNKSYPSLATSTENIFLAKYQLEPIAGCTVSTSHKFLVPTYMSSIPEDPQNKAKFSPDGSGRNCVTESQAGQYLYVPIISTDSEPVKNYYLAAKVERENNKSTSLPVDVDVGLYGRAGQTFCTKSTTPPCTHNFYLGPKKNQ